MGKAFTQVTMEERCEIARLRAQGSSVRQIARWLGMKARVRVMLRGWVPVFDVLLTRSEGSFAEAKSSPLARDGPFANGPYGVSEASVDRLALGHGGGLPRAAPPLWIPAFGRNDDGSGVEE